MVAEIDGVAPAPGEDEALDARLPALQHAERLAEAADAATSALRGEQGALDRLGDATASLARVSGIDPAIDGIAARLQEASALVDDASGATRAYRDAVEHDPAALDAAMSRASALAGLKRKYGPRLDDVLAARDAARKALGECEDFEQAITRAEAELKAAESELREAARLLSTARMAAAPEFEKALRDAATNLAMTAARFEVSFTDLAFEAWTESGPQRVEFLYAPAAGQPARPLVRIASGGEVSRVMLALKGVLGTADTTETLVFDEVDAGIGGATAHAVGQQLAWLSASHQVIVVTHLAQVAAYADRQLVVNRTTAAAPTAATSVIEVIGEQREAEIARMLSGDASEASLAHARELLGSAQAARGGTAGEPAAAW